MPQRCPSRQPELPRPPDRGGSEHPRPPANSWGSATVDATSEPTPNEGDGHHSSPRTAASSSGSAT
eukprot:8949853-Lingulodinium_polyedra.AAC.1